MTKVNITCISVNLQLQKIVRPTAHCGDKVVPETLKIFQDTTTVCCV
jgi:hypothetical protein